MKGGRMNAEVDDWKETNEYKRTYVPNAFGATVQRSESAGHARAHSTPKKKRPTKVDKHLTTSKSQGAMQGTRTTFASVVEGTMGGHVDATGRLFQARTPSATTQAGRR